MLKEKKNYFSGLKVSQVRHQKTWFLTVTYVRTAGPRKTYPEVQRSPVALNQACGFQKCHCFLQQQI